MMIKSIQTLLVGGVAGVAVLLGATSAQAVGFKLGEIDAKLDTTVSVGIGIRTSAADCTKIGVINGGCYAPGPFGNKAGVNGYDAGPTNDNSNILNKQWQPFSEVVKIVPELSLTWQNYGAFIRGQASFDYWAQNKLGAHSTDRFVNQSIDYGTGNATAFNRAGYGAKLLDAFIYGQWGIGNVRLGNQVINWGESLFIQGGINAFQPIDANQIVKPGSELKEAYTPDPLINIQMSLPNDLALEGFYKFAWNKTTLPVAGTFFGGYAAADIIGPGQVFTPFGMDYTQALDAGAKLAVLDGLDTGISTTDFVGNAVHAGALMRRQEDNDPSSQGQFGLKLGYYADWMNDGTDLGFYLTHFHGGMPYLDFTVAGLDSTNPSSAAAGSLLAQFTAGERKQAFADNLVANGSENQTLMEYHTVMTGACAAGDAIEVQNNSAATCALSAGGSINMANVIKSGLLSSVSHMRYLTNYAPNIDSFGFSFNTVLPTIFNGTAFSGEFSYTPRNPLQRDVFTGILANNLALAMSNSALISDGTPINANYGSIITPWTERKTIDGQFGFISTLPATYPGVSLTGSDLMILVANVGFQYIPNLSSTDYLSGAHSTAGSPNAFVDAIFGAGMCLGNPGGVNNPAADCPGTHQFFASSFSWGYRLAVSADYNNALGTAWTITPSIVWSHDVRGISAGPIGPGFVHGIKKIKFGIAGKYQSAWRVSLDWTSAFGNKYLNDNYDKDYATATVSYAF